MIKLRAINRGHRRPLPGRYLARVREVKCVQPEGILVVTFAMLSGSLPGQRGAVHRERYRLNREHADRLTALALAAQLLEPGEAREVDFLAAINRRVMLELQRGPLLNRRWTLQLARIEPASAAPADEPTEPPVPGSAPLATPSSWRSVAIERLGLSPRVCEILREEQLDPIKTLGDIAAWGLDRPLTDLRGIEESTAEEILAACERYWRERLEPDHAMPLA